MTFDGRLKELGTLKFDWDGYKGLAPTKEAIDSAMHMTPVPMPDGGIQLEIHIPGGSVEIEIMPDGHIGPVLFIPNPNNNPR